MYKASVVLRERRVSSFQLVGKENFPFHVLADILYSTLWLCRLPCHILLLPGLLMGGQQWDSEAEGASQISHLASSCVAGEPVFP